MKKYFFLMMMVLCSNAYSQPSITWAKTFGGTKVDDIFDMQATEDGNLICVGCTSSSDSDLIGCNQGLDINGWVIKIDINGNVLWSKCYGGSMYDYLMGCVPLPNGDIIVAGITFSNDGDVSGNHSWGSDMWVLKLDSLGNIIWQHCYGGTAGEQVGINGGSAFIAPTSDKGFLISSLSNSSDGDLTWFYGGLRDAWIYKIDSIGTLLWQRSIGGTDDEFAAVVIEGNNKENLALITSYSTDFDLGDVTLYGMADMLLVVLDSAGEITKKLSLGGESKEIGRQIINCSQSGYLISASSFSQTLIRVSEQCLS